MFNGNGQLWISSGVPLAGIGIIFVIATLFVAGILFLIAYICQEPKDRKVFVLLGIATILAAPAVYIFSMWIVVASVLAILAGMVLILFMQRRMKST